MLLRSSFSSQTLFLSHKYVFHATLCKLCLPCVLRQEDACMLTFDINDARFFAQIWTKRQNSDTLIGLKYRTRYPCRCFRTGARTHTCIRTRGQTSICACERVHGCRRKKSWQPFCEEANGFNDFTVTCAYMVVKVLHLHHEIMDSNSQLPGNAETDFHHFWLKQSKTKTNCAHAQTHAFAHASILVSTRDMHTLTPKKTGPQVRRS